MSIRHWPAAERPREKLLQRGAESLSDAELLAIFLRTGTAGRNAIELGRDLLEQHGGLRAWLDLPPARLKACRGLGPATIALLMAALELGRRYLLADLQRGDALANPDSTRRFLQSRLRGYPHEVFACLFLDNRHRVIEYEALFRGTIDGASVHPREVVKTALAHNAAAVILAHNHPSGVAEPSQADLHLTRRLREALGLVDIRVLDHLVIGDGEVVSFAERGLL
ncbi:MAG: DNA repair protein RadC [Gammaproteobacteria bacterium]|nr:DNA repair protein RadC [Gammaproteobacteria bacterium]MBU2478963.1 DNA repair protein RadC [Gammaproteobacteria bacterium]